MHAVSACANDCCAPFRSSLASTRQIQRRQTIAPTDEGSGERQVLLARREDGLTVCFVAARGTTMATTAALPTATATGPATATTTTASASALLSPALVIARAAPFTDGAGVP